MARRGKFIRRHAAGIAADVMAVAPFEADRAIAVHRTPPCVSVAHSRMASASASLSSAGLKPRARIAAMTAALSALPLPVTCRLIVPTGTPWYPGEHAAIIDHDLWNKVHSILQQSPRQRASNTRTQAPALLKGIIFTETGAAMTPTATKKGSRLYRYYTSMDLIRSRATGENAGPQRLPAGMIEAAVVGEIQRMVRAPEVAAQTIEALRTEDGSVDERAVISALGSFDQLWASLFPAEQARIVQLLVERVTIGTNGVAVDLRNDGLGSIVRDMITPRNEVHA